MENNRWKNYGLWLSIAAFIPLLLSSFGINMIPNYQEIVNAFLALLVTAGIISNPTTKNLWYRDDKGTEEDSTTENSPINK